MTGSPSGPSSGPVSGPLSGYAIGVTADRRSDEQISLLSGRGATIVHGPTIKTHPLRAEAEIKAATDAFLADPPDIVVLSTAIGFRSWLGAADSLQLGEQLRTRLRSVDLVSRGPKARGAVVTADLDVVWNAPQSTFAEIVEHFREEGVADQRVAVVLDGSDSGGLVEGLTALGAIVVPIPVYRWTLPEDRSPAETLARAVAERRVDAITFTARPAVENFATIAEDIGVLDEVRAACADRVQIFTIGPVCAQGVDAAALGIAIEPRVPRLGSLVTCVTESLGRRSGEVRIGGAVVEVTGNMLRIDSGEPVSLTGRERDVFDVLAERPGVVVAKDVLLSRIWGSQETDTHVVEVTVGRLRRRLGPAGEGVETVMRRGYRLSEH